MGGSLRHLVAERCRGRTWRGDAVLEDSADVAGAFAGCADGFRRSRAGARFRAGRQLVWDRRVRGNGARQHALDGAAAGAAGPERARAASCGCRRCTGTCSATTTRPERRAPGHTDWCVDRDRAVRHHHVDGRGPAVRHRRPQERHDVQQVRLHQQGLGQPPLRAHLHRQPGRLGSTDADFTADPAGRLPGDGQGPRRSPTARRSAASTPSGNTWLPIGRPAKIGSGVQVGVYAADNAADGPVVPYDSFALNAQSDEFAGDALEKCRWSSIVREAAAGYRVANGALEIDTGAGEIDGTAPNLIGQPVPGGNWEAETKVDLTTTLQGQQAGLAALQGERELAQGRARPHGRDHGADRVRARPQQASTSSTRRSRSASRRRSRRSACGCRSTARSATAQYSTNGTMWIEVGKARDISRPERGQPRPGGAARRRGRRRSTAQVRLRPRAPRQPLHDDRHHAHGTRASSARSTATRRTRCRPRRCRRPARSARRPTTPTDDVPLRMPDTTGTMPNLAEFRGQTLTLDPADQKTFSKLHFFGTTADGSGGGNVHAQLRRRLDADRRRSTSRTGAARPTARRTSRSARMTQRYRTTGGDGARCSIYHVAVDNPPPTRKLVSVTLPPATTGGGGATRAYLMALTLEEPSGAFEMPDLTGVNQFPNDNAAPESERRGRRRARRRAAGTRPRRGSRSPAPTSRAAPASSRSSTGSTAGRRSSTPRRST